MKVDINFDEQPLIKALIDNVIQEIKDEFHKLFPRLRREDMDNPMLRGSLENVVSPDVPKGDTIYKTEPEVKYNIPVVFPRGFYFAEKRENGSMELTGFHTDFLE